MKLPNGAVRVRIDFGGGVYAESPSSPDNKPDVWSVHQHKLEDARVTLVAGGVQFKEAASLARRLARYAGGIRIAPARPRAEVCR